MVRIRSFAWTCPLVALVALGCGGDDEGRNLSTLGDGLSSIGPDDDGSGSGEDDMDAGSSEDDGGIKLDLGDSGTGNTAGDGGNGEGCQKVDLLFVIDNSGSMQDEQASLVASFSGFVAGIQAELANADSYHIGVVTTDAYDNNAAGCNQLGALVTQTGGEAAAGQDCLPFSSGKRYLDDTEPDLDAKFSCIAQVGISGSGDEIQAEAGYRALSPIINGAGACNDGFIRQDALLVVVIITDEDDAEDCVPLLGCLGGGSQGGPPDWFQIYSQYKSGIQENIVMLALVGTTANNSCGADHCMRLIALTNWFFNGSYGDICAPSYETFFNDAISVIDDACDNFTPPE